MATSSQHRCVFVGNIPYDATEEQLIQICEEVGPVVSFRLVIDRETGKPKGYGFCEYKDEETALSARRNLQGYEINGRQLRVDFAENDKGADRNREQGRGGPGLTSNVDAQKQLGGPVLGDSVIYQPIGHPLAATAASIMAGALGGAQTDSMSSKQSGLPSQSGLGNDPLTHYLANMSRKQLYEIISEIKVMATQNKELAHQLLLASPQLPKALFQAQIMLGMVTPQVLQMPNIRQSTGSFLQPQVQDGIQDQKPAVLPPHPGQTSLTQNKVQFGLMQRVQETQGSAVPQTASVNSQPSTLPFQQALMQPRFHHSHQAQSQHLPQTTMPGQSGVSTVPSLRPFTGLSMRPQAALETSTALNQQMQLPLQQNPRPVGAANLGHNTPLVVSNATAHNSLLPRPLLSQPSFQPGSSNSMILPGAPETVNKHAERSAPVTDDTPWFPRSNAYSNLPLGLSKQTSMLGDTLEPTNHPSKLARLEDGRSALHTMMSQKTSTTSGSVPTPDFVTGSLPSNRISAEGQHSEKQVPQLQLAPELESALLQQVMNLTSEQLSSLPPEQRQQVIQLQQMLR